MGFGSGKLVKPRFLEYIYILYENTKINFEDEFSRFFAICS
jgi:hypothetical protein